MRLALLLIAFLLFAGMEPGIWLNDYKKAMETSRQTEKPVLIYFSGSDWCKPCILLSKEALEKEEFLSFAEENLVLVKADFPRLKKNRLSTELQSHNESLAEKFNPNGEFPLLVIVDQQERVLYRSGYTQGGAEYYIKAIGSSLDHD